MGMDIHKVRTKKKLKGKTPILLYHEIFTHHGQYPTVTLININDKYNKLNFNYTIRQGK
jgi:hypothetical protein